MVANIILTNEERLIQGESLCLGATAEEVHETVVGHQEPVVPSFRVVAESASVDREVMSRWRKEGAMSWLSFVGDREELEDLSANEREGLSAIRKQIGNIAEVMSEVDPFCDDCEFVQSITCAGGAVLIKDGDRPRLVLRGAGKKKKTLKGLNRFGKGVGRELQGAVIQAAVDRVTGKGAYNFGGLGKALKAAASKEVSNQKQRAITQLTKGISGQGFYRGMGAYRGSGAYEHQYNQLFPGQTQDSAMHIAAANNETGNITIRKREYLFDVFSPTVPANFTTTQFQANPGLGGLGLFVSQIASNYEKYRYRQLIFTYKPTVTDSSSTGQMGSVLLAFNSNAGASKFVTKQQMAEYDGAMSVRVCDAATLGVECDPKKGADSWNFIRVGSVPTGQDIKSYDFGTFTVATAGLSSGVFPAGTLLGEMWVDYTVELAGPKLYDGMGYSNLVDSFYGTASSNAYPLGSNIYKSSLNSLGGRITLTSQTRYTFPDNFQGWVRVVCYISGATANNIAITETGQITGFQCMIDSTTNVSTLTSNSVSGLYSLRVTTYKVEFAKTAEGNYLILAGTITGGINGWITIEQMNSLPGFMSGVGTTYVPN